MTGQWAVRLPAAQLNALGRLRQAPGVQVLELGGAIWLRGEQRDEKLRRRLATLPEARLHSVLDDGQLVELHRRVPSGHLPSGDWAELSQWLQVALPTAALPAQVTERPVLRIVRGGAAQDANVLLTEGSHWLNFGGSSAAIRLKPLTFAVSSSPTVVIRGTPLPPLPGERFVEIGGIAVAAGYRWDPPVRAERG